MRYGFNFETEVTKDIILYAKCKEDEKPPVVVPSIEKYRVIFHGEEGYEDLSPNDWYYEDVVEATNGHIYDEKRLEDGSEVWLELKDFKEEMR